MLSLFTRLDPIDIPDTSSVINAAFQEWIHIKTGGIVILLWNADRVSKGGGWYWRVIRKGFTSKNLQRFRLPPGEAEPYFTQAIAEEVDRLCMA